MLPGTSVAKRTDSSALQNRRLIVRLITIVILITMATSSLMATDVGIVASTLRSSERSLGNLSGWGLFASNRIVERMIIRLDYRHLRGEVRPERWVDLGLLAKSNTAHAAQWKINNRLDSFDATLIASVWDQPEFSFGFGPGVSVNWIDQSDESHSVTRPGVSFAMHASTMPARRLPLRVDLSFKLKHILGDDTLHLETHDWYSEGVGIMELSFGLAYVL